MMGFGLASFFVVLLGAEAAVMLLEAFLQRKDTASLTIASSGCAVVITTLYLGNHLFCGDLLSPFILIATGACIVAVVFYAASFMHKVAVAVLSLLFVHAISLICEVLGVWLFRMAFEGPEMRLEYYLFQHIEYAIRICPGRFFLWMIFSELAVFAICNGIRLLKQQDDIQAGKRYWGMVVSIFVIASLSVLLMFSVMLQTPASEINEMLAISVLGLLACVFIALYFYEYQGRQAAELATQRQYVQQLRAQVKHLDDVMLQQDKLRRFKHDCANQLIALRGYFKDSNPTEGMAYVERMLGRLDRIAPAIDTGNVVLDAMLNEKMTLAQSKGIHFETHLQIASTLQMDAEDVCVIFGNALDNAIEACERMEQEERRIHLTLFQQDQMLFCKLVNTANPMDIKDSKTSKKDVKNHGMGLDHIRMALKCYGSELQMEYKEGLFILKFVIALSR